MINVAVVCPNTECRNPQLTLVNNSVYVCNDCEFTMRVDDLNRTMQRALDTEFAKAS